MKKTLLLNCSLVLLAASFSFSAHAEKFVLDRECTSRGPVKEGALKGSMVSLVLYKGKASYQAVFTKNSERTPFLKVDGIRIGKTGLFGASALTNKKDFEFTSDSEAPSRDYELSYVDFNHDRKNIHIVLSCNHAG